MLPFQGNLPDQIWGRLKEWAKVQARTETSPTHDECVAQVQRIIRVITGRTDSVRHDVVTFYANETAEMIAGFREPNGSPGTTDLEAAI